MTTAVAKRRKSSAALTLPEMCRMFQRHHLTIQNWRKFRGLPCIYVRGEGLGPILYNKADVLAWAKKEGQKVYED